MKEQVFSAIDIGSSKLTVIIATMDDNEKIRVLGFDSSPSKGVKKGLIVDIDEVIKTLNISLSKAEKMAGRNVEISLIAVGGPHINSLNSHGIVAVSSQNGIVTQDDINRVLEAAKAVSMPSTRKIVDISPREYILDGQPGVTNPIGMTAVRLEVVTHIISASVTNLSNAEKVFHTLGIQNKGFVFSAVASAEAVLTDTEKELGVVCVDIGGGKTDIAIYSEGALTYSSSIPIGAKHITNDIAAGTQVTLDEAEKIKLYISAIMNEKKSTAIADDPIDKQKLGIYTENELNAKTIAKEIMAPRIEELFELVSDEIKKADISDGTPAGVVLTGGGALTGAMASYARRGTGLPARVGYPRDIGGISDAVQSPIYATALGLITLSSVEKQPIKDDGFDFKVPAANKLFDTIRKFLNQYKLGS